MQVKAFFKGFLLTFAVAFVVLLIKTASYIETTLPVDALPHVEYSVPVKPMDSPGPPSRTQSHTFFLLYEEPGRVQLPAPETLPIEIRGVDCWGVEGLDLIDS